MPNCLGANVLDTALVDGAPAWERIQQADMAAVTILDGSHPEQALAFAGRLRRERPQTMVLYRRYRDELPDATLWERLTPAQFVELFRPALEMGCYACTHCEAAPDELTRLADFETKVLDITAPKGWRLAVFKMSTGSPGGYRGEQPDHYASFDALWRSMAAANRDPLGRNEFPAVIAAPHAYFQQQGLGGGMLDRPPEIHRRAAELGLDTRLIPIHIGETGLVYEQADGRLDPNAGYRDKKVRLDPTRYARMVYDVVRTHFLPRGYIPHLWSLGASVGGWMSGSFDTLWDDPFWKALQGLCANGSLRLPTWYGQGGSIQQETWRAYFWERAIPARLIGNNLRVRALPTVDGSIVATLPPEGVVGLYVLPSDLKPEDRHPATIGSERGLWQPVFLNSSERGWVFGPYLRTAPLIGGQPTPANQGVTLRLTPQERDVLAAVLEKLAN